MNAECNILRDMDGNLLDTGTLKHAYFGSEPDTDVVWRAVADAIDSMCFNAIAKIVKDIDIRNRQWFTDPWCESRRYADDIIRDWQVYGKPTFVSLTDTVLFYARYITELACDTPAHTFRWPDDFVTDWYYSAPRIIHPAEKPPEYVFGEGHNKDAITCTPCKK